MNIAVFFQKYGKNSCISILSKLYKKFFLRSNRAILKYLRNAGAIIGDGTVIHNINILGSEPWLVEIGINTYFSGVETKIFTHDGGVERLYYMGVAPHRYDYFEPMIQNVYQKRRYSEAHIDQYEMIRRQKER